MEDTNDKTRLEDVETAGVLAFTGHLESVEELNLSYIDLSSVPSNIVSSLLKLVSFCLILGGGPIVPGLMSGNIRVKNVSLNCLFDDATDLLDRITCDKLAINSMSLSIDETRCLTEMLNSRVRMLTLKQSTVKTLEKSFLTKYDGEGHCQCIQYECYVGNENQIYWKNEVKDMF